MTDANPSIYQGHFVRTPFQLLGRMEWKKLVAFMAPVVPGLGRALASPRPIRVTTP
jgi:hypothetical protein